jgi:penicillin-binding protein activator
MEVSPRTLGAVGMVTALSLFGCQAPVDNAAGRPTVYQDVGSPGLVSGVGIESQDIVGMTDKMMRDMLASPVLAGGQTVPRVILDSAYFNNESTQRLNKNLIVDRLRVELQRAAAGRMVFVSRENAEMVAQERDLKRAGYVDTATSGLTRAQAGADYRLAGRISSLDGHDRSTGTAQRYNQITFEMIDLESGTIDWSGIYEFQKAAQDDVVYR